MTTIKKATENDFASIVKVGRVSVFEAHKGSCPEADLHQYIQTNYSDEAIRAELRDPKNVYHVLYNDAEPIGFSKIVLNAAHPNIIGENTTKLDRIYLLKEFQGKSLGFELLNFNVDYAKNRRQSGIWLYTWVGNSRAINFYEKTGFKIIGSHQFYVTETSSNLNHQMLLTFSQQNS